MTWEHGLFSLCRVQLRLFPIPIKMLATIFVSSKHLVTLGVLPSNQISLLQLSARGVTRRRKSTCLMSLTIQLLNGDLDPFSWFIRGLNDAPIHTAKPTLPNHERPAEVAGGVLQFREGKHPEPRRPVGEAWVLHPPYRLGTHIRDIHRVEV
jgi:hypothetical protein